MPSRREKGKEAEELAASWLSERGLKIITRNFYVRGGEIDIIARDGNTLCIVEVRSKGENSPLQPEEQISDEKIKRVKTAADRFVKKHRLFSVPVRLDLLVVEYVDGAPVVKFYPGGLTSDVLT